MVTKALSRMDSGPARLKMSYEEFLVRLSRSAREPDVLFVASENLERLTEQRLEGPADLVIEIISETQE